MAQKNLSPRKMGVCVNCGHRNKITNPKCTTCGLPLRLKNLGEQSNYKQKSKSRRKRSGLSNISIAKGFLWIFLFPIMFSLYAFRKKSKYLYVISGLIWIFVIFSRNNVDTKQTAQNQAQTFKTLKITKSEQAFHNTPTRTFKPTIASLATSTPTIPKTNTPDTRETPKAIDQINTEPDNLTQTSSPP